jgi:RNA polymerase sigma factor (sigma-70 family)
MSGRILSFPSVLSVGPPVPGRRSGPAAGSLLSRTRPRDPAASGAPPTPEDAERFRQALLPHLDAAYGFARYLCRDATAAEDLVQDAYLKAFRSFSGYRGGDPKAWLFAIVRTTFLSSARRRQVWDATIRQAIPDAEEAVSEAATPEEELVRSADLAGLRQAVDGLPDPFRETLVLRELQEMSYREIAEITGAPIGTVMSRLARARSMLTRALCGPGGEP